MSSFLHDYLVWAMVFGVDNCKIDSKCRTPGTGHRGLDAYPAPGIQDAIA